eukprot:290608_1
MTNKTSLKIINASKHKIISNYHIGRYVTFLAGAGLTTASFLVSGGSLALLSGGIMCGAGLQLSIKSLQALLNQQKEEKENENECNWNKLLFNTSLGALNGLISSVGIICITQKNECNMGDY